MIVSLLLMGAVSPASDTLSGEAAVKSALEQEWTDLTVSEMVNIGCINPFYVGLRISRTQSGCSIARWQMDQKGERLGPRKDFDAASLPKFIEDTLKHYAVALASDDIHEQIARLKTEEERQKAWVAAIEATGVRPIGGFGSEGIDIRIVIDGREKHFKDHFGKDGAEDFAKWLRELGADYQP